MKTIWKRLGAGLGGAVVGAGLGVFVGFVETYVFIFTCAKLLGLRDQEGLIILAGAPFGAVHGGVVGLLVGLGARNALGWVLGALVGLGLWAPLFLSGTRSTVIGLLALAMPLWCGGMGAAVQALSTRKKAHPTMESPAIMVGEDGPAASAAPVQIAGNRCKVCEHNVVISCEGKFCARCRTVVHCTCEPRVRCEVCDEAYQAR